MTLVDVVRACRVSADNAGSFRPCWHAQILDSSLEPKKAWQILQEIQWHDCCLFAPKHGVLQLTYDGRDPNEAGGWGGLWSRAADTTVDDGLGRDSGYPSRWGGDIHGYLGELAPAELDRLGSHLEFPLPRRVPSGSTLPESIGRFVTLYAPWFSYLHEIAAIPEADSDGGSREAADRNSVIVNLDRAKVSIIRPKIHSYTKYIARQIDDAIRAALSELSDALALFAELQSLYCWMRTEDWDDDLKHCRADAELLTLVQSQIPSVTEPALGRDKAIDVWERFQSIFEAASRAETRGQAAYDGYYAAQSYGELVKRCSDLEHSRQEPEGAAVGGVSDDLYLSARELAEVLRVSYSALRSRIRRHRDHRTIPDHAFEEVNHPRHHGPKTRYQVRWARQLAEGIKRRAQERAPNAHRKKT